MINKKKHEDIEKFPFREWTKIMTDYKNNRLGEVNLNEDDSIKNIYAVAGIFSDILKFSSKVGQFKDEWNEPTFMLHMEGIDVSLKSKKTNIPIEMGFDYKGFYLKSYILFGEGIRYMNDDFWLIYLNLKNYGDFKFDTNAGISGKNEHEVKILKNNRSNLFVLVRNYLLMEVHNGEVSDLGHITLRWSWQTHWEVLIEKASMTFKDLYKLNYLLWKSSE